MAERGPRGRGRGDPARGRGDGGFTPQGRGRGTGSNPQDSVRGGRGDGRGGRGDGRGGRGDGRGGASFRRLGDDEHTPGPKIFRCVLHSYQTFSLLTSVIR